MLAESHASSMYVKALQLITVTPSSKPLQELLRRAVIVLCSGDLALVKHLRRNKFPHRLLCVARGASQQDSDASPKQEKNSLQGSEEDPRVQPTSTDHSDINSASELL